MKLGKYLVSLKAGVFAALLYIAAFNCFEGRGQSPIFYSFLVLLAFSSVIVNFEKIKNDSASLLKTGVFAMCFLGVAIEIKPTVVSEGISLGLYLVWLTWQHGKKGKAVFSHMLI
ncbi:hypothetical protein FAI41_01640 [Acetobacteraceae bacterium]|nr:hypothetical protein FAI41_01640 [Acetobacteraceae bacterium]